MIKNLILKYKILKYISLLKQTYVYSKKIFTNGYLGGVFETEKQIHVCIDIDNLNVISKLFNKKIIHEKHSKEYYKLYIVINDVMFYTTESEVIND